MTKNDDMSFDWRHSSWVIFSNLGMLLVLVTLKAGAQSVDMTTNGPFTADQAASGLVKHSLRGSVGIPNNVTQNMVA